MIARIWRGTVRTEDADEYARYISDTGFAEYGRTPGNRGAWMLRRDEGGETEFITLSMWDSSDAIKAFAGEDIEAAVLYPRGREVPDRRLDDRALRRRRRGLSRAERRHAVGPDQQRRAAEDPERARGDGVEPADGDGRRALLRRPARARAR